MAGQVRLKHFTCAWASSCASENLPRSTTTTSLTRSSPRNFLVPSCFGTTSSVKSPKLSSTVYSRISTDCLMIEAQYIHLLDLVHHYNAQGLLQKTPPTPSSTPPPTLSDPAVTSGISPTTFSSTSSAESCSRTARCLPCSSSPTRLRSLCSW